MVFTIRFTAQYTRIQTLYRVQREVVSVSPYRLNFQARTHTHKNTFDFLTKINKVDYHFHFVLNERIKCHCGAHFSSQQQNHSPSSYSDFNTRRHPHIETWCTQRARTLHAQKILAATVLSKTNISKIPKAIFKHFIIVHFFTSIAIDW